jgi:hypothetical protein
MIEELFSGFILILYVSTGPIGDADLTPHKVAAFKTEAACELAGQKLVGQTAQFAGQIKKNGKVSTAYACLSQQ